MLPKSTEFRKPLHKTKIIEKFKKEINPKRLEKFGEDISRIYIVNEISEQSMDLIPGEKVKRIFVVEVNLKYEDIDIENIAMLSRYFNQYILYKLKIGDKIKLAIYEDRIYFGEFQPDSELEIVIKGRNLDTVWENLILDITGYEIDEENTLTEQLEIEGKKEKLKKEIERLEAQKRREKQPNKKFELHQKAVILKSELKYLK